MIRQILLYEIIAGIILYATKQLSHHFWFVDFGWEVVFLIMVVVPVVHILANTPIWLPKLFSGIKRYYKIIIVSIVFVISFMVYKDQEMQKKHYEEFRKKRIERAEKQLKKKGYFVLSGEKIICFYDLSCKQYAMNGYYSDKPFFVTDFFWDFTGGIDSNASNREIKKRST